MTPHTIDRLTLHHTATRLEANSEAPGRARAHQAFHLESGFADLAYHFLIDLEGNVLEGRPVEYAGETFTGYEPAGHLLVCCEGSYSEQSPTDVQRAAVADIFAWACRTFEVDPSTLAGHRDYAPSICPGDRLYASIADGSLRRAVETRVASGVERRDVCGPVAARRITQIEDGTG